MGCVSVWEWASCLVVYGLCFRMGVGVLFGCVWAVFPYGSGCLVSLCMGCGLTCRDREEVPFDCAMFWCFGLTFFYCTG